jgi:CDP-glycerol glycerophosphotransferase (TagB/SpsB family)
MIPEFQSMFFVFMPHPLMLYGTGEFDAGFRSQSDELIAILRKTENVYVDTADDYRPSLLRADAIIIDRSALMIEAGVTGKPIFYMYNAYNKEKLTDAVEPLIDTYYQGTTADDITAFLNMFEKGADPNKDIREKAFRECVTYTDGKCGERIADDIVLGIISEQSPTAYRIAIFGMGEVFRYYSEASRLLHRRGVEVTVISDNNASLWGTEYRGIPIVSPTQLRDCDFDVVVIFSEQYFMDIFKQLVYDVIIDIDKIVRLDKFLLSLN